MNEEDIDSNIDWEKSKSFSKNTRASRRLDQKKVSMVDNLNKNGFKPVAKPIKPIHPNLKKIQSKIRDIYDEEDMTIGNNISEMKFYFTFSAQ